MSHRRPTPGCLPFRLLFFFLSLTPPTGVLFPDSIMREYSGQLYYNHICTYTHSIHTIEARYTPQSRTSMACSAVRSPLPWDPIPVPLYILGAYAHFISGCHEKTYSSWHGGCSALENSCLTVGPALLWAHLLAWVPGTRYQAHLVFLGWGLACNVPCAP